jgi:serine/threonine protein kinase
MCLVLLHRGVCVPAGGSSGWQAPEQLIAKDGGTARQSRAIDVFSLGCIMFYCLSGGKHPFGEHYERDTNIIRGHCSLTALHKWPEAVNLLSAMLSKQPLQRPLMAGVLRHPFWWSDEQRLQFLVDVSDRFAWLARGGGGGRELRHGPEGPWPDSCHVCGDWTALLSPVCSWLLFG